MNTSAEWLFITYNAKPGKKGLRKKEAEMWYEDQSTMFSDTQLEQKLRESNVGIPEGGLSASEYAASKTAASAAIANDGDGESGSEGDSTDSLPQPPRQGTIAPPPMHQIFRPNITMTTVDDWLYEADMQMHSNLFYDSGYDDLRFLKDLAKENKLTQVLESLASGLQWRNTGNIRPSEGTELPRNEKLATALQTKLEFDQVEWDAFGVKGITIDHFIKAGDSYFQPAGLGITDVKLSKLVDSLLDKDRDLQCTPLSDYEMSTLADTMKNKKRPHSEVVTKLREIEADRIEVRKHEYKKYREIHFFDMNLPGFRRPCADLRCCSYECHEEEDFDAFFF